MQINSDYRDLLLRFKGLGVRYLVAGGYAVMRYTEPFYTKDIDLWVESTPENAIKVLAALQSFGAPTGDLTVKDRAPQACSSRSALLPTESIL